MSNTKTFKGTVCISRFTGSSNGISITLTDDTSRVQVVRLEMTPEAFGDAITGLGYQECTFELGRAELVGMQAEYKTEVVPFDGYTRDKDAKKAAVAPFEVDGWRADLDDLGNMHRWIGAKKGYTVGFRRHVPAAPAAV